MMTGYKGVELKLLLPTLTSDGGNDGLMGELAGNLVGCFLRRDAKKYFER